eukprot:c32131_g1_i1 orf=145-342(+)
MQSESWMTIRRQFSSPAWRRQINRRRDCLQSNYLDRCLVKIWWLSSSVRFDDFKIKVLLVWIQER